eukprot:12425923-Ditylum_brightwellii.AAC.1
MLQAYDKMYKYLQDKGYKPYTHWLNIEAPAGIKWYNTQNTTMYQLVPPNTHRRNAAERAIMTFKKYYKAILASVDPKFPLHLWFCLLPQSCMTLNMLRPCWYNPKLSAYASLEGVHDYNVHPVAPFGTEVTVYETANQRATWGLSGIKG